MTIFPARITTEADSVAQAAKQVKAYRVLYALRSNSEVLTWVKGTFKDRYGNLVFFRSATLVDITPSLTIKWYDRDLDKYVHLVPIDPTFELQVAL